jgi:large subunit ribosomal protein L14e
MDVGRVCIKLTGREAGNKCVIINVLDRNFVMVTGPKIRRRRVNMNHLKPIDEFVNISRNATDEEVASILTD